MGRWIAELRGHKRAAKVHYPLSEQIKADGAEILDEAVLTVTPKGTARVDDPRRSQVTSGTHGRAMAAGERKDEK